MHLQFWTATYLFYGFSWWLSSKESACQCRRHRRRGFHPWVGKLPWRRKWQPTPVFLPGEILRTEEPGGLRPKVMKSPTWLSNWACTYLFYSNAERLASWPFAKGSQQWIAAEYRGFGACFSHSWQTNWSAKPPAQGPQEHSSLHHTPTVSTLPSSPERDSSSFLCVRLLGRRSCLTLCDPMDCSPPGSSVHRIVQARILEWAAIFSPRRSSQPRDQTCLPHCRWILDLLSHQGSPFFFSKK